MSVDKYTEERPWGRFERFCRNQVCTVKIISVEPNQALSLQYHEKREEFWRVLAGEADFFIGEEIYPGKSGDEFMIPRLAKHRIQTGASAVSVLEISFGEFDENDIVRLEDKYGRK